MRLRSLFDVELPQADQLPDGAVLLYDRALGRWVARVLNTGGGVQLGFNTSSVTINQTTSTPVQITSVSLPAGSWIVVGVIQAEADSTTSATLYGYLRSGTTNLRSFSVTANSNHGLLTVVLMLLRTVTSNEMITLAGATSSTTYTFTVPEYGGYLLAIEYNPVN